MELELNGCKTFQRVFQSLKGFGGLWNSGLVGGRKLDCQFQSLKGFGGLWNIEIIPDSMVYQWGQLFQSLKGFGGLWN